MTEAIIGILFAACGVAIHFILKDAFSRDKRGRYTLTKGVYRKLLSLEGQGSMLSFSAFNQHEEEQDIRSQSRDEHLLSGVNIGNPHSNTEEIAKHVK